MTLVFERQVDGPATHALVVGVGSYPLAKTDRPGIPIELCSVRDLPSAVAGAKIFADWLIANGNALPASLATVELLLSDAAGPAVYEWSVGPSADVLPAASDPRGGQTAVEAATYPQTFAAGQRFSQRFMDLPTKHFAVLYFCGHGIATPTQALVFLEELSGMPNPASCWEPYVDVQTTAAAMTRIGGIEAAYVFVDACRQRSETFDLDHGVPVGGGDTPCRIFAPERLRLGRSNTLLLVPGAMGALAFDDGSGTGGRFTRVLVEALEGGAAKNVSGMGDWAVPVETLAKSMHHIYKLTWKDGWMVPEASRAPADVPPLVKFADAPIVKVHIRTEPGEAMLEADAVWMEDQTGTVIDQKGCIERIWKAEVTAKLGNCVIRASFPPSAPYFADVGTKVDLSEMRVEPILVHKVTL